MAIFKGKSPENQLVVDQFYRESASQITGNSLTMVAHVSKQK